MRNHAICLFHNKALQQREINLKKVFNLSALLRESHGTLVSIPAHHIDSQMLLTCFDDTCVKYLINNFKLYKRDSSKEMPGKLTSAASASKCHMLLFLQLCKLWDV